MSRLRPVSGGNPGRGRRGGGVPTRSRGGALPAGGGRPPSSIVQRRLHPPVAANRRSGPAARGRSHSIPCRGTIGPPPRQFSLPRRSLD